MLTSVSHFLELNLLSKTILQEDLQSNLCMCLLRLLSRLILLQPSNSDQNDPMKKLRLVERLLEVFGQINIRGRYQEYFSLGIVVEHILFKMGQQQGTAEIICFIPYLGCVC